MVSFSDVFMQTALLNWVTACHHLSWSIAVQSWMLAHPYAFKLICKLASTLILSSPSLVNSGTAFLHLYFFLPLTWILSRGGYQDTSPVSWWSLSFFLLWSFARAAINGLHFKCFALNCLHCWKIQFREFRFLTIFCRYYESTVRIKLWEMCSRLYCLSVCLFAAWGP